MEIMNEIYLWKSPDGDMFADVPTYEGIIKTMSLAPGGPFYAWLDQETRTKTGNIQSNMSLQALFRAICAECLLHGDTLDPKLRINGDMHDIWIDMCSAGGNVIHVTRDGWTIENCAPCKFLRGRGGLPLPVPDGGDDLFELLSPFIHTRTSDDLLLIVSWLIGTLNPKGPYPVLIVTGEQGSAKSTTMKVLQELIDPHTKGLRSPFKSERDLAAAVWNSYVLAFDNMSYLKGELSDALCGISTGTRSLGGRRLYSDKDEAGFLVARPIMLNGIPDFVERGDLLDRAIQLDLPRLSSYRADNAFWSEFRSAQPRILGALLDLVSRAMRYYDTVDNKGLPRMSNFCQWVMAALNGRREEFLEVFTKNRSEARKGLLDYSITADAIKSLLIDKNPWYGTIKDLSSDLIMYKNGCAGDLPKTWQGLAAELKRIAPSLREVGIHYHDNGRAWVRGAERGKHMIELRMTDE